MAAVAALQCRGSSPRCLSSAAASPPSAAAAASPPSEAAASASLSLACADALPLTWLSHWQHQEARRLARRAVIDGTRGRQQERLRQLATSLSAPSSPLPPSTLSANSSSAVPCDSDSGDEFDDLPPSLEELRGIMEELPPPPLQQQQPWPSEPGGEGSLHLWQSQQQPQQQQQDRQLEAELDAGAAAAAAAGVVEVRVRGDTLSVRPLWVAVHQPDEGGPAQ